MGAYVGINAADLYAIWHEMAYAEKWTPEQREAINAVFRRLSDFESEKFKKWNDEVMKALGELKEAN